LFKELQNQKNKNSVPPGVFHFLVALIIKITRILDMEESNKNDHHYKGTQNF
jgi:hypothetical protein